MMNSCSLRHKMSNLLGNVWKENSRGVYKSLRVNRSIWARDLHHAHKAFAQDMIAEFERIKWPLGSKNGRLAVSFQAQRLGSFWFHSLSLNFSTLLRSPSMTKTQMIDTIILTICRVFVAQLGCNRAKAPGWVCLWVWNFYFDSWELFLCVSS